MSPQSGEFPREVFTLCHVCGHKAYDEVGSCQKKLETCDADLSDCKVGCKPQLASQPEDTVVSPCGGEQMFFRRFARSFIKMLITETEQDGIPLAAEVKVELNSHKWNKLRQFDQQNGKLKLVDAYDLMMDMLVGVHHDNIIESSWLERLTGMEWNDIKFALSHTVAIMILEPLQHMGRAIGEFHRELLKDLPYAAWIPANLFPYLSVVLVIVILYYRPSRGLRREDPRLHLVDRIQMLEGRLDELKAIIQRLQRVQALEMPRPPAQREYFEEPAAGLRPRSKGRRRNKSNSEPDLQLRQQQKSVVFGRVENVHYQGDVSNGSDSSDEAESQLRHQRDPVNKQY